MVVGLDDPERGEEVCAVIVPATTAIDLAAVAAHAREQLSAYKVPTRWAVATSAQIPTLASGKLNRKALRTAVIEANSTPFA